MADLQESSASISVSKEDPGTVRVAFNKPEDQPEASHDDPPTEEEAKAEEISFEIDDKTSPAMAEPTPPTTKETEKESEEGVKPVPVHKLFRFATAFDWLLISISIISAILHGCALPGAMYVFGDLTNLFFNHDISRQVFSEIQTNISSIYGNFMFVENGSLPNVTSAIATLTITPNILATDTNITTLTVLAFNAISNSNTTTFDELSWLGCLISNYSSEAIDGLDTNFKVLRELATNSEYTLLVTTDTCRCVQSQFTSFSQEAVCYSNDTFFFGRGGIDGILWVIYLFLIISGGSFILGSIQTMTMKLASERQVYRVRVKLYSSFLKQDIGWFDCNDVGELAVLQQENVDKFSDGIGDKFATLIQWLTTFFAGFVVGFIRGWQLALLLTFITPFMAVAGIIFYRVAASFTSQEQKLYAGAGAIAEEVLSSVRTVVAFGGEYKEVDRYESQLEDARKVGGKKGAAVGASLGSFYIIVFIIYAVAFWFGGYLISVEILLAGDMLAVFYAILVGSLSLGQATPSIESVVNATGAAGEIFEIIDREPPINSDSDEGLKPDDFKPSITFKDVVFRYPARPDVPVLTGLDLQVDVGQTVALVGSSGSGKSTVISLIQRFYNPLGGQITVGGYDIKELNLKWLRSNIGVVSQEPVLFDTTIAENISYGKEGATTEEIEAAARAANAHNFISELPDRYNTLVGDKGAQLSGGQKQRIAIARALVRDPKILLLDEATSALDTESEKIVQEALDKAREGRTTFIIAHRLSTIQQADAQPPSSHYSTTLMTLTPLPLNLPLPLKGEVLLSVGDLIVLFKPDDESVTVFMEFHILAMLMVLIFLKILKKREGRLLGSLLPAFEGISDEELHQYTSSVWEDFVKFPSLREKIKWDVYLVYKSLFGHYSLLFLLHGYDEGFLIHLKVSDSRETKFHLNRVSLHTFAIDPRYKNHKALLMGTTEPLTALDIVKKAHDRLTRMGNYHTSLNNCQDYCEKVAKDIGAYKNFEKAQDVATGSAAVGIGAGVVTGVIASIFVGRMAVPLALGAAALASGASAQSLSGDMKEEDDGVIPEVSLLRIIKANSKEWWLIALGLLGSVILGFIYPVFALIFGEILDIFARPPSEILSGLHPWAGLFLGIGVVVGLGAFIRSLCLGIAGENLTARLRTWSFRTFLRQDMSWFDKEENSAGALTTKLSTDASLVQGATGSRLGTLVEISVAMLLSLIISFVYSWMLTLVLAGFIPVFMLAGFLQFRANAESIKSSTDSSTVAGKIVIESLVNIRTVTSLGIQSNFFQSYTNEIRGPYKRALIKSPVLGAAYGFSQGVLYLGYVVTFGFGAYQVTRQPGDIAHSTFSNIFVVFTAVIFGALGAGQASSFAPDYAKAKQSANRIFALLDREPAIDGYSEDGLKPREMSSEEPPEVNGGQKADGSPRKSPKKMTVYPSTSEDIPLKEIRTEPSKTVRVSESYEDAIEKPSVTIKKKKSAWKFWEKDEEDEVDPNKPKPVPVYKLFRFATKFDLVLIFVSFFFAILHGTALPGAMYVFGDFINFFAYHDASRTVFENIRVAYYGTYNGYSFDQNLNLSLSEAIENMTVTPGLVMNQALLMEFNNASGFGAGLSDSILTGLSCVIVSYANDSIDDLDSPFEVLQRLATDNDYMLQVTSNACSHCLRAQFEDFNDEARCLSNDVFFNGDGSVGDGVFWQLYLYGMITVATFILAFLQISTMQLACERQVYKIRLAYYRAVLHQDIGWFDLNASGELTSRLNESHIESESEDLIKRQSSIKVKRVTSRQDSTKEEISEKRLEKLEEEWDKDIPDVSLMRVMKANAPEWWLIGLGLIGSLFLGAMNPLFAVFFGEIIEVFARPASEVLDGLHLWAGLFLALGFAAAAGTFLKSFCFTVAGENLTARLREWSFRAILRQEIGWFDNERNSSGILATRLAQDASRVQGATGSRLGTLIETFVGMFASIIIAFVYSWMLTLVLIGFVPVFIISGILEVKALTGHAGDNKKALEQAGKIAVDTIENMRTVASLGVEIKFYTAYNTEIKGPYKKNLVNSFVYGLTYGFSQSVIYLGFILTFGFGAYQVTRPPGHIAHESFSDLLTVLMAVIFGAVGAGQASSFAPNYTKAKQSANRIFALLDREPVVDGYSEDGLKPEKVVARIEVKDVETWPDSGTCGSQWVW
uniref:Uncharacterized protein n=2 Tax=Amphimedon queenslandica TaxID=400682 RepID=A0A1X7UDM9_AMPQE